MALISYKAKLTGVRPLLMHNGQLADPTNPHARALKEATSKKKKTDADYIELKKLEWFGGLYLDENGKIAVTEDMLLGCVTAGARKAKNGKEALAGLMGASPFYPLEYDGPKDLKKLYETGKCCDYRLVVIQRNRVMRARPKFNKWSLPIELLFDDSVITEAEVTAALAAAGAQIGLGDFRPRFGRFTVERVS